MMRGEDTCFCKYDEGEGYGALSAAIHIDAFTYSFMISLNY
jgi:hypothetical protein